MSVFDVDTSGAKLPASYSAAKAALMECSRIDECKEWADRASALASYAKQAQDSQLEDMAKRIKNRALRRAGELLDQIDPAKGGDRGGGRGNQRDGTVPLVSRKQAASEAGLSERQAKQVLRMAQVPEPVFEDMVERGATATEIADAGTVKKPVNRDDARKLMTAARAYRDSLQRLDLDEAVQGLGQSEAAELRIIIGRLDHVHDRIATSI